MHLGGQVQGLDHGDEEATALGHTFHQMDPRAGPAFQKYGQDDTGKARAGAQVCPGQGVGFERQKLRAVIGVPAPECGERRGADQIHPAVPILEHQAEGLQIGHLLRRRGHGAGEAGGVDDLRAGVRALILQGVGRNPAFRAWLGRAGLRQGRAGGGPLNGDRGAERHDG